jgi:hypothetical protein
MRHLKKLLKNIWLERKRYAIEKRKKKLRKIKRKRFYKFKLRRFSKVVWKKNWFREYYNNVNISTYDFFEIRDEKLYNFTHKIFQLKWNNPKLRWIEKTNLNFFLKNYYKTSPARISRFKLNSLFFKITNKWKERWSWLLKKEFWRKPRRFKFILKQNKNVEINSRIFAFSIISSEFLHSTRSAISKPMAFTYSLNKFIRHFF